jgi:hypothetical protein
MGGTYSTLGRNEKCVQILLRKPEGKRPFVIRGPRLECSINKDHKEIVYEGVARI